METEGTAECRCLYADIFPAYYCMYSSSSPSNRNVKTLLYHGQEQALFPARILDHPLYVRQVYRSLQFRLILLSNWPSPPASRGQSMLGPCSSRPGRRLVDEGGALRSDPALRRIEENPALRPCGVWHRGMPSRSARRSRRLLV